MIKIMTRHADIVREHISKAEVVKFHGIIAIMTAKIIADLFKEAHIRGLDHEAMNFIGRLESWLE
ncbi:hypothetical protein NC653_028267 [Populus alba x Populus x berolinensis]|uniref:Uncharacterized protein n=1 Tax=Populus alba x Populus x berolinensis TaxID=444605 RepID=A0AAD6M819_9ROSI|nr:hypothetical protein NC653_028267 [Populus alba x Populus x berolinensis]